MRLAFAAAVCVTLASSACGAREDAASSTEALSAQPAASQLFAPATKRVVIEIDYARGAAPYVGPMVTFGDPWRVSRDNVRALIGDTKELILPTRLSEMERLDDVASPELSREDLIAIAAKHRDYVSRGDTVTFYVVFVDAWFKDDDGTVLRQTPGVSVRGAGVIGIFKPAITLGLEGPATPTFLEQATLVHELGHAIGLVDDGIQPTSAHRDERNGAHCGNPACIMYYKNVLVKDGVDFVDTYWKPRRGVLFGPECLADVRALWAERPSATVDR